MTLPPEARSTASIDLGPLAIETEQYAIQGNAILGIKETGKSYTATMFAERLMDAGVPIVALDPIGIWRFLRVAGSGPGYPVVVAGGEHGDLPLTPEGAPEIVKAAMRDGVSLVLDLYSMELSKADWRRIVAASVRTLLYENKRHGLRHVFIEEAAEFCPQRPGPDQGTVYAEVEKLARMGGNVSLGYTLINPRAEEVSKSVLELCDALFLFRQKGKNSLLSLGKWLDAAGATDHKQITASIPGLAQGECYAWPAGAETPTRIPRMPAKRTFHPDRRARREDIQTAQRSAVDVSAFVEHMAGTLDALAKEAEESDPKKLRARIALLERNARDLVSTVIDGDVLATETAQARQEGYAEGRTDGHKIGTWEGQERVRLVLVQLEEVSRVASQAVEIVKGVMADRPVDETGEISALVASRREQPAADARAAGMERRPTRATAAPPRRAPAPEPQHRGVARRQSESTGALPGPQQRVLDALAWWESVGVTAPSRIQVAIVAEYSPSGGAFLNPLGNLRTNGWVDYPSPGTIALTAQGRRHARRPSGHVSTSELHAKIMHILDGPRRKILGPLLRAYPRPLTRENLAQAAGYEPKGGAFLNPLGTLRSLGLVDYPKPGQVQAKSVLFIEGRR